MKKVRILSLVLAVVLAVSLLALTSCGSKKYTETVSVVFRAPKGEYALMSAKEISAAINAGAKDSDVYEILFEYDEVTIEGSEEDPTTVLKAATTILDQYEIDSELSKDGTYIASVKFDKTLYAQQDSVDATTGYYSYWECTINDELSNSGRQSVTEVYTGDKIVYTWTSSSQPRQDTAAVEEYDSNLDTTSEIPTDDTTIAQEDVEVA